MLTYFYKFVEQLFLTCSLCAEYGTVWYTYNEEQGLVPLCKPRFLSVRTSLILGPTLLC